MLPLTLLLAALCAGPVFSGERGAKAGVAPATPTPVAAPIPTLAPSAIVSPAVPGVPAAPAQAPAAVLQQNAAIASAQAKTVVAELPRGLANAWTKLEVPESLQKSLAAQLERAYPTTNTKQFHSRDSSHEFSAMVATMLAGVPAGELDRRDRVTIQLAAALYAADPKRAEGSLPRNSSVLEYIQDDLALVDLMEELGVSPKEVAAYAAAMGYASSQQGADRIDEEAFMRALELFPDERRLAAQKMQRRLALMRRAFPFLGSTGETARKVQLLASESRRTASLALGRTVDQPTDSMVLQSARRLTLGLKDESDLRAFTDDSRRLLEQSLKHLQPADTLVDLGERRLNSAGQEAKVRVGRPEQDGMSAQIDIDYGDGRVIQFAQTNRGRRELAGWSRFGHDTHAAAYPEELVDASTMKGLFVADIGTGEGALVEDLNEAGVRVIGIDARLRPELQRRPKLFKEADGKALPFASGSVDILYSNWSIPLYFHEEENFYPFLQEWARVLKKGGRMRMSPVHPDNWPLILVHMKALGLELSPDIKLKRVERHNRGPFIGMLYEIFWKGKEWNGDPFLELVKK